MPLTPLAFFIPSLPNLRCIFEEAQEIYLRGNIQVSECNADCMIQILRELLSYFEKVPSPLDPVGFFRKIFSSQPPA